MPRAFRRAAIACEGAGIVEDARGGAEELVNGVTIAGTDGGHEVGAGERGGGGGEGWRGRETLVARREALAADVERRVLGDVPGGERAFSLVVSHGGREGWTRSLEEREGMTRDKASQ